MKNESTSAADAPLQPVHSPGIVAPALSPECDYLDIDDMNEEQVESPSLNTLESGGSYRGVVEKNIYCYGDRFAVRMRLDGQPYSVGSFFTIEEARAARESFLLSMSAESEEQGKQGTVAQHKHIKRPSSASPPSFDSAKRKCEGENAASVRTDIQWKSEGEAAASTGADAPSACAMHPTKACIYLCTQCQKAVCEVCCMSLNGQCKGHAGYLIQDVPLLVAERQHRELGR
jgi:hypothetical protein